MKVAETESSPDIGTLRFPVRSWAHAAHAALVLTCGVGAIAAL
jgi:hypothetical protein